MHSRSSDRAASTLLLAACLAIACACRNEPEQKPVEVVPPPPARAENLLLIIVDTLRADHLGVYGYTAHPTSPNLDALAARSTVFDEAYSHAPWTLPSVASIMTSLQPRDHGVLKWTHTLLPGYRTLAETLHDAGFYTMAVIAHLIFEPDYGFAQGFDTYDRSILDAGHPHRVTSSGMVTDKLIAALEARPGSRPWFAWAHYFDPHNDYQKQPGFEFGDEPEQRYDSEIAFTDRHIGRLLDYLEEEGLLESTAIAFVADHGEEFMDHGRTGHTLTLYDEVIRVPLMIYVPGLEPRRVPEIVATIDLAPTLLALVGLAAPPEFAGRSIPISNGAFSPGTDRAVFSETRRTRQLRGVRLGDWKYVRDLKKDTEKLFNLSADPLEKTDLSGAEPERLRELGELVEENYERPTTRIDERTLPEKVVKRLKNLGYLD